MHLIKYINFLTTNNELHYLNISKLLIKYSLKIYEDDPGISPLNNLIKNKI